MVSSAQLPQYNASIISPLRYPGGKKRLVGYLAALLNLNDIKPKLFVEPFAGGASAAIQLLNDGLVENIMLGDKDELVSAFWYTVFYDTDWLIKRIEETEPTLALWEKYKTSLPKSRRERAFACLFLNRTSFSGILSGTAGPIGGRAQSSAYSIGCRFPKERIIKRIKQAALLSDKVILVNKGTWQDTISKSLNYGFEASDILYYFDPPFYYKADRLYRYFFEGMQHKNLANAISSLKSPYILSYDVAEPIIKIYSGLGIVPTQVELLYSTNSKDGLVKSNELIVTNLPNLPVQNKLWNSKLDHVRVASSSLNIQSAV